MVFSENILITEHQELSDKAVRHAEFLAQDDGVIHLLHVLPGSASLSLHRFAAD
ncbi:hypothetical protein ACUODJ_61960, partial [Escherichia sp. HC-CC]